MGKLVENKKVNLDYEILETIEAGAELLGLEVKSLRARQGSLAGARVLVRGGEAMLVGATIPPYQVLNTAKTYEPDRVRKLLVSKKECARLEEIEKEKGLTLVPISWYTKSRLIKLSVGIARGKKKFDKRESIKRKDMKRDIARAHKVQLR